MASRSKAKTDSGLALRIAAVASLGAALIHFAVAPTHWQEWLPAGQFFVLLAGFQLVWACAVLARPASPVLATAILVNLGSIALWAVSRTAGAPFGPHAGEPELVRAAGLCALLLQIYVVMGAGWTWFRRHRADRVPGFGYRVVLSGAGTVIAVAAAVGVTSGLQHGHHPPTDTAEHEHRAPVDAESGHHHDDPAPSTGGGEGAGSTESIERDDAATPNAPTGPSPGPDQADHQEHDHD